MLCCALTALAQRTSLSAQVSSRTVGLQEQFQLTITVSNPTERYTFLEPSLRDFRKLSGPHESTTTNFSTINGKSTQQYTISYTYVLQPLRQGTFTIGAAGIRTQRGQEQVTAPVTIKVTAQRPAGTSRSRNSGSYDEAMDEMDRRMQEAIRQQQQMMQQFFDEPEEPEALPIDDVSSLTEAHLNENIFIRAEVDHKNPFVGQQINVVYKLYTRLKMSLSPTALPVLNGFWAQDEQRQPDNTPVQENYNGKRYNVFVLKKTALFAQQSGMLKLDPAKAEGSVEVAAPVGAGRYVPQTIPVSIESPVVDIQVKPLPAQQPLDFTGGVGQFSLAANISRRQMSTDDVVQLVLTLSGSGNLGLINAPVLKLPAGLSASDPELLDSVLYLMPKLMGTRQFVYQISADSAGHYTIPPVVMSYYDIGSGQYQTLSTGTYRLDVSQGTRVKSTKEGGVEQMRDIHGLNTVMPAFGQPAKPLLQQVYYWLLYVIALLILSFLLWKHQRKAHREQNADVYWKKWADKEAWKRLAAARNALQNSSHTIFYEEVSKAVWLYLSDKLGMPISDLGKENLAQKLRFRAIEEPLITQTLELITECELALYSPAGAQQQQQAILAEAGKLIGIYETRFKKK